MKHRIIGAVLSVAILFAGILPVLLPKYAYASPGWLTDYPYRQKVTIANAGALLTNYPVEFHIDKDGAATAGWVIDLDNHCANWPIDIRWTNADGETLLDFWREENDGVDGTWWVELDSLPNGNTDFYIYCGHAGAADASDGGNTFILFDDFEGGVDGNTLHNESLPTGGVWTVPCITVEYDDNDTIAPWGGLLMMKNEGTVARPEVHTPLVTSDNIAIRYRGYKETAHENFQIRHGDGVTLCAVNVDNLEDIYWFGAGWQDTGSNMAADAWTLWELRDFDWAAKTFDLYYNGGLIGNNLAMGASGLATDQLFFVDSGTIGRDAWRDNVLVRNYREANQPTVGAWAAEQAAALPTTTTQAATGIGSTSATLNGNVTNTGLHGEPLDERGFVWDLASQGAPGNVAPGASGYAWSWSDVGSHTVGAFTHVPTLICETQYWYRAYSHNFLGYAYGAEQNFTTGACLTMTARCTGFGHDWAVINIRLDFVPGALPTQARVRYGLTGAYGLTETRVVTLAVGESTNIIIRGLNAGTVYHFNAGLFQAGWYNDDVDMVFSTKGSPTRFEYLNTGGDGDSDDIYANEWGYQTFEVDTNAHSVQYIRLNLKRTLAPGVVTASLRHASGDEPTGLDLVWGYIDGDEISAAYAWYQFTMNEAYSLEAGEDYAIVVRALNGDAANFIEWQVDTGGGLADARYGASTDGGVSWTVDAGGDDALFELWGYPSLMVHDAKVFTGYLQPNDWLIVANTENTYPPYFNESQDPSLSFQLQLIDDSNEIMAAVPCQYWERQPLGIYVSAAHASSFTWGGDYLVRVRYLHGAAYQEYPLEATDWPGDHEFWLRQWMRVTAANLGDYYGATYLVDTSDRGMILNEEGSVLFQRGIPAIADILPDMFLVVYSEIGWDEGTFTKAYQTSRADWETNVGTGLAGVFNAANAMLGIDPKLFGGISLLFIFILFGGLLSWGLDAWGGILLSAPCVFTIWWFGLMSGEILFTILFLTGGLMVYRIWFTK